MKTALYFLLSNNSITKSRIIFVHDRSNIENEFNNSWYLSRAVLILLQVWQFRTYCLTSRIISDQRWFFFSSFIVLFIFEWLDANWSCISCINDNRFDSNIMINSTACRKLSCSNRFENSKIWFYYFWRSFFLFDTFFALLISESAFSFDFFDK
jgi:hypothetical protein